MINQLVYSWGVHFQKQVLTQTKKGKLEFVLDFMPLRQTWGFTIPTGFIDTYKKTTVYKEPKEPKETADEWCSSVFCCKPEPIFPTIIILLSFFFFFSSPYPLKYTRMWYTKEVRTVSYFQTSFIVTVKKTQLCVCPCMGVFVISKGKYMSTMEDRKCQN